MVAGSNLRASENFSPHNSTGLHRFVGISTGSSYGMLIHKPLRLIFDPGIHLMEFNSIISYFLAFTLLYYMSFVWSI